MWVLWELLKGNVLPAVLVPLPAPVLDKHLVQVCCASATRMAVGLWELLLTWNLLSAVLVLLQDAHPVQVCCA
jgi:hypothetical protein